MKIAIVSDTHDNTPAIVWIIEYLNEHKIPVALHAGDMINPGVTRRFAEHYQGDFHYVFGNNDGERTIGIERAQKYSWSNVYCHKESMELEIEGKKIFMNHFSSISENVAKSGKFDVCIGGHDHLYRVNYFGKTLFINPGNIVTKDKWLPQEPDKESSFVLLDLSTMKYERIMLPEEFQYKD